MAVLPKDTPATIKQATIALGKVWYNEQHNPSQSPVESGTLYSNKERSQSGDAIKATLNVKLLENTDSYDQFNSQDKKPEDPTQNTTTSSPGSGR